MSEAALEARVRLRITEVSMNKKIKETKMEILFESFCSF